jgi:hypothetical protein
MFTDFKFGNIVILGFVIIFICVVIYFIAVLI